MANFFKDNPDLMFTLNHLDLAESTKLQENGYKYAETYDNAPVDYADALDNFNRVLEVVGEICGDRIEPRSRTVDAEGPIESTPEHHGPLLVLGAFVKAGKSNPALQTLLANAPLEDEPPKEFQGYDPSPLLPPMLRHYAFPGSLTTPPYTEPVEWIVLADPVEAAAEEIEQIKDILGDNTRPIQPLNGRRVAFGK